MKIHRQAVIHRHPAVTDGLPSTVTPYICKKGVTVTKCWQQHPTPTRTPKANNANPLLEMVPDAEFSARIADARNRGLVPFRVDWITDGTWPVTFTCAQGTAKAGTGAKAAPKPPPGKESFSGAIARGLAALAPLFYDRQAKNKSPPAKEARCRQETNEASSRQRKDGHRASDPAGSLNLPEPAGRCRLRCA